MIVLAFSTEAHRSSSPALCAIAPRGGWSS